MNRPSGDIAQRLPAQDDIRARAYEIAMARGFQPGHELDDWLQAEYELMQLPIRKIAELDLPKPARGKPSRKSLVTLVRSALF